MEFSRFLIKMVIAIFSLVDDIVPPYDARFECSEEKNPRKGTDEGIRDRRQET